MKRRKILTLTICFVTIWAIELYYSLPGYKIINSFAFAAGNYRESEFYVIANKDCFNPALDDLIEEEYSRVNGACSSLTINIYFSKWTYKNGMKPFRIKVYDYGSSLNDNLTCWYEYADRIKIKNERIRIGIIPTRILRVYTCWSLSCLLSICTNSESLDFTWTE